MRVLYLLFLLLVVEEGFSSLQPLESLELLDKREVQEVKEITDSYDRVYTLFPQECRNFTITNGTAYSLKIPRPGTLVGSGAIRLITHNISKVPEWENYDSVNMIVETLEPVGEIKVCNPLLRDRVDYHVTFTKIVPTPTPSVSVASNESIIADTHVEYPTRHSSSEISIAALVISLASFSCIVLYCAWRTLMLYAEHCIGKSANTGGQHEPVEMNEP